jgi:hypothetical protein
MIEKIGGRKFIFGLLLLFMSFVLVLLDKLSTDQWTVFASITGGTYIIGNVASKLTPKYEEEELG